MLRGLEDVVKSAKRDDRKTNVAIGTSLVHSDRGNSMGSLVIIPSSLDLSESNMFRTVPSQHGQDAKSLCGRLREIAKNLKHASKIDTLS